MSDAVATIDLNADLGEGFGSWRMGDDDALLDVVSSANVACGFHAGDPVTMARVCERAAARGVRVGAHVSWRDLEGFGRRNLDISPAQLRAEILAQLGSLRALAGAAGINVGYVKAHGALYNRCFHDAALAGAVLDAVVAFDSSLVVLGQPGSVLLDDAMARGIRIAAEGFADRGYQANGQLVARTIPGAVLDTATAVAQALRIACERTVATDGGDIALTVGTLCVHGDSPDAVELARTIRAELERAGVSIAPFA